MDLSGQINEIYQRLDTISLSLKTAAQLKQLHINNRARGTHVDNTIPDLVPYNFIVNRY